MAEPTCALSSVAVLRARNLMDPATLTVGEHESLASAWEMLARSECRYLPVLRGSTVVGILDDHAVVCARSTRSLDGRQRQVGEFSRAARFVAPDAPMATLLPALFEGGGVVVVLDRGQVLGLVTSEHVAGVLAAALGTSGHAPDAEPEPSRIPLSACVGTVVPSGPTDA
jgi:CBS-domain-containing membrane protein